MMGQTSPPGGCSSLRSQIPSGQPGAGLPFWLEVPTSALGGGGGGCGDLDGAWRVQSRQLLQLQAVNCCVGEAGPVVPHLLSQESPPNLHFYVKSPNLKMLHQALKHCWLKKTSLLGQPGSLGCHLKTL